MLQAFNSMGIFLKFDKLNKFFIRDFDNYSYIGNFYSIIKKLSGSKLMFILKNEGNFVIFLSNLLSPEFEIF
jgi:hypothetical protein